MNPSVTTVRNITFPPLSCAETVKRRKKKVRSAVQDEGAPKKNHSECISYEHVMRSVIQNPKALSSKKLERGGDDVYVCKCECVYVCVISKKEEGIG